MVSSAIWKNTCTSEFFKDDRFEVFEKLTSVCFSKLHEKNIQLIINNIHGKMIKNRMFRRHLRTKKATPFEHRFPCLLAFFLSLYPPCI